MKPHTPFLPKLGILASLALSLGATQAAIVITDFSSFSAEPNLRSSGWNQTVSTTTGPGTNTVTFTASASGSVAGQTAFLSEEFSLATAGSRITVDFGSLGGSGNDRSIGLAVASSASITERENLLAFFWRGAGGVTYQTWNESGSGPRNNATGSFGDAFAESIFIERTANDEYLLGSILGGIETIHWTLAIGSGSVTADGIAVGMYSDVRSNNQVNTLNNFAFIPEPSTALLGGIGMLLLLRRRR